MSATGPRGWCLHSPAPSHTGTWHSSNCFIAAGCSGGSGTDVAAAAAALALRSLASATAQQHATIGSCDSGSAFSMGSDSYGGRSCGAGGDFDGGGEA